MVLLNFFKFIIPVVVHYGASYLFKINFSSIYYSTKCFNMNMPDSQDIPPHCQRRFLMDYDS